MSLLSHYSPEQVRHALRRAFERFLNVYAEFGQHRFHGSADWRDPAIYRGPVFWTEAECVFRMALALEKEFPGCVHMGFQFSKFSAYPWAAERDTKAEIDLVVSDLTGFEPDDTSHHRAGARTHETFLEAKHRPKGHWKRDIDRKIDITNPADFVKLMRLKPSRCFIAACLVVDDEDHVYKAIESGRLSPPPEVELLLAPPSVVSERRSAP